MCTARGGVVNIIFLGALMSFVGVHYIEIQCAGKVLRITCKYGEMFRWRLRLEFLLAIHVVDDLRSQTGIGNMSTFNFTRSLVNG